MLIRLVTDPIDAKHSSAYQVQVSPSPVAWSPTPDTPTGLSPGTGTGDRCSARAWGRGSRRGVTGKGAPAAISAMAPRMWCCALLLPRLDKRPHAFQLRMEVPSRGAYRPT